MKDLAESDDPSADMVTLTVCGPILPNRAICIPSPGTPLSPPPWGVRSKTWEGKIGKQLEDMNVHKEEKSNCAHTLFVRVEGAVRGRCVALSARAVTTPGARIELQTQIGWIKQDKSTIQKFEKNAVIPQIMSIPARPKSLLRAPPALGAGLRRRSYPRPVPTQTALDRDPPAVQFLLLK